jgi:ATP-dependent Clp protease, protease subunit
MRIIHNKDPRIKGNVKDLIDLPIVIRIGDIDDKAATDFSKSMTEAYNTGQEVIPVVIDSAGGCVYSLFSILSDIESSRLPVATICVGKAMSAGSVLLAHGSPGMRFIDPNSTVMIHEISSSIWWSKLAELKVNVEEADRLNQIVFMKMALACGHKKKEYFLNIINQKKNADWYLDCFEAKKHKLVDHIGIPEFQINLSCKVDFIFVKPEIETF